jgi:murein DD-endopeptidase MepM/ murein hydrolase activator NlpD
MISLTTLILAFALAWAGPAPPAPIPAPIPATGVWPLDPHRVVAGFDPPRTPWDAAHRGVDLAGVPGEPVRSALAGTITFAGVIAGRGVVVVSHGAFRTTYEPVAARVSAGGPITRGGVLGVLEVAGTHCPPRACLHWGLIEGEQYLDPLQLVGAAEVRLLPTARLAGQARGWASW